MTPVRPQTVSSLKPLWIVWLAILAPLLFFFGSVLFTDRVLAMRDSGHFYYPLLEWTCREWAAGRVPLWNPWEFCGLPVVADASSAVFYPGKLLFLLPASFAFRYNLYIVAHVLLAAYTSWRLARAWGASPIAAGVTAVAYSYGGVIVYQYCNVVFLLGAAWTPLALEALESMLARLRWQSLVGLSVVLALMILGGDPQAAFHVLLLGLLRLALAWWSGEPLGEAAQSPEGEALSREGEAPLREGEAPAEPKARFAYRPLALACGFFVAATGLAYLLAAVQILPSSEVAKNSERAAYLYPRNVLEVAHYVASPPAGVQEPVSTAVLKGVFGPPQRTTHHERAYDFSISPWRWIELLWPNVGGRMFPTARRWMGMIPGDGRIWTPSLYLGVLPLVLGLFALRFRGGDPRVRWISWAVVLFWLGSFGLYGFGALANTIYFRSTGKELPIGNGVGGVYWFLVTFVPSYIYFRYPAKLFTLAALGLALLAGLSWDRLLHRNESKWLRPTLAGIAGVSGVLATLTWLPCGYFALLAQAGRTAQVFADQALGPFDLIGSLTDTALAFTQTAAVCVAALWITNQAKWRPRERELALLFLVAAEITFANSWMIFSAPAEIWREEPKVAQLAKANRLPGEQVDANLPPRIFRARLSGWWRPASYQTQGSPLRIEEMAAWERDTLFPKYGMLSGVEIVESYGSLKANDFDSLFVHGRFLGEPQVDQYRLPVAVALRLLGVEFLVTPENHKPSFAEPIAAGEEAVAVNAAIWRMKRTLPRAWIVHQAEILPPLRDPRLLQAVDQRTEEVLVVASPTGRQARNFRTTAVIETDRPLEQPIPRTAATEAAGFTPPSAKITAYTPQQVAIDARLSHPGVLVLADAFSPGWTARYRPLGPGDAPAEPALTVPASAWRPLEILRTNRVLRGVCLPSGAWKVEFAYQPASFYRGGIISLLSWTAVLGLFFMGWRRRRI